MIFLFLCLALGFREIILIVFLQNFILWQSFKEMRSTTGSTLAPLQKTIVVRAAVRKKVVVTE